jgi:hypothetical protein
VAERKELGEASLVGLQHQAERVRSTWRRLPGRVRASRALLSEALALGIPLGQREMRNERLDSTRLRALAYRCSIAHGVLAEAIICGRTR